MKKIIKKIFILPPVPVVVIAVRQNKGFEYSGLLIYTMALYAFYSIITAVINVVKFRKYGNLIMSAAKVINLTAALVSMLSLETAMIAQFGSDAAAFRQIMTSARRKNKDWEGMPDGQYSCSGR